MNPKPLTWWRQGLMLLAVATVVAVVMVPNDWLAYSRSEWRWFGQLMNELDALGLQWRINLIHVIVFGALGLLTFVLFPHSPFGLTVLALVSLSVATEYLQLLAIGRHFRGSDIAANVVASLAVWGVLRVAKHVWLKNSKIKSLINNL